MADDGIGEVFRGGAGELAPFAGTVPRESAGHGHLLLEMALQGKERDVRAAFGAAYDAYAATTPRLLPHPRELAGAAKQTQPRGAARMSALAETGAHPRLLRRLTARAWAWLLAVWAAVTGVAPHVLHHVGPLAGAALLAGTGGGLLFAALALFVSIPFLLRIHHRFRSWLAPAIALAAMAGAFALSSLLVAPLFTGSDSGPATPGIQQPAGHLGHHPK